MKAKFLLPIFIAADISLVYAYQAISDVDVDPIASIIAQVPTVGLLIWYGLKIDERHRKSMENQRKFYQETLTMVMKFAQEIKAPSED